MPSAASAGCDAQLADLQYDHAVMGSLAVMHTAGLTLALAGQQLLAWQDRCRVQKHPAGFQVGMQPYLLSTVSAFLMMLRVASLTLEGQQV